jgi:ParB family chromosome partitioning protein
MTAEKPRRLGRGLEALIGSAATSATSSELQRIGITRIRPNPFQPRREFDPEALAELESSIRTSGLLQPITVRKTGEVFELIAGERRLRAATNLGWKDIPAIVRDFDDQMLLVLALVENLQRADLNPIEEARGFQRLLGEFELTQQQVADAVGKDRTTVTNLLRVLTLPDAIQRAVEAGQLSLGHARALLAVDDAEDMSRLANEVIANGLSVRETERRARATRMTAAPQPPKALRGASQPSRRDAAVANIEDELRRYLQTDVQLQLTGPEKGSLRIAFYSADDLDRLLDLIIRDRQGNQREIEDTSATV